MDGEALLGPLPTQYERIFQVDRSSGKDYTAHMSHVAVEIQVQDPRLGPLPENRLFRHPQKQKFWPWFYNEKTGEGEEYPDRGDPRLSSKALTE